MTDGAPKYALLERERRFIVDPGLLPDLSSHQTRLITDRYITGTRLRLRMVATAASGQVVFKLGKKYPSGSARERPIVNTYLDQSEYTLLSRLPAKSLVKTRFTVTVDSQAFALDRFEAPHSGLCSPNAKPNRPPC